MATTKDRQEELTNAERRLRDPDVAALQHLLAARGPISGRRAAVSATAWVVLLGIGIAVEPAPANPNAVDPWFVDALAMLVLTTVVGAFAGFWLRQRWSLAASLVASGLLVVSTLACPMSGHHTQVGAWWVVQLGCGLGLVATSILGLRRG